MIEIKCNNCDKELKVYPSRLKTTKSGNIFCNKSCHRSYDNKVNNPSKDRDLSGKNNPMWGKHPIAWNKGLKGKNCHNWKGGIHKRKDGYFRINIKGKRHLLHRFLLKDSLKEGNIVHHKDHNPSNNDIKNLEVIKNQKEHARLHGKK